MCNTRQPPTGIQNIQTNEIQPCLYGGMLSISSGLCGYFTDITKDRISYPYYRDIITPGMYYICATGSFYSYFDGEYWWSDGSSWGQETIHPRPKRYTQYKFLFNDDHTHNY